MDFGQINGALDQLNQMPQEQMQERINEQHWSFNDFAKLITGAILEMNKSWELDDEQTRTLLAKLMDTKELHSASDFQDQAMQPADQAVTTPAEAAPQAAEAPLAQQVAQEAEGVPSDLSLPEDDEFIASVEAQLGQQPSQAPEQQVAAQAGQGDFGKWGKKKKEGDYWQAVTNTQTWANVDNQTINQQLQPQGQQFGTFEQQQQAQQQALQQSKDIFGDIARRNLGVDLNTIQALQTGTQQLQEGTQAELDIIGQRQEEQRQRTEELFGPEAKPRQEALSALEEQRAAQVAQAQRLSRIQSARLLTEAEATTGTETGKQLLLGGTLAERGVERVAEIEGRFAQARTELVERYNVRYNQLLDNVIANQNLTSQAKINLVQDIVKRRDSVAQSINQAQRQFIETQTAPDVQTAQNQLQLFTGLLNEATQQKWAQEGRVFRNQILGSLAQEGILLSDQEKEQVLTGDYATAMDVIGQKITAANPLAAPQGQAPAGTQTPFTIEGFETGQPLGTGVSTSTTEDGIGYYNVDMANNVGSIKHTPASKLADGTYEKNYTGINVGSGGVNGLDLDGNIGDPILSPGAGEIVQVQIGSDRNPTGDEVRAHNAAAGGGASTVVPENFVLVRYGDRIVRFGHLSPKGLAELKARVDAWDNRIWRGDSIGAMWNTGTVWAGAGGDGSHLDVMVFPAETDAPETTGPALNTSDVSKFLNTLWQEGQQQTGIQIEGLGGITGTGEDYTAIELLRDFQSILPQTGGTDLEQVNLRLVNRAISDLETNPAEFLGNLSPEQKVKKINKTRENAVKAAEKSIISIDEELNKINKQNEANRLLGLPERTDTSELDQKRRNLESFILKYS